MPKPFSQYLRERRERAIRDGDARPRVRAFQANGGYFLAPVASVEDIEDTDAWLATDQPKENRG